MDERRTPGRRGATGRRVADRFRDRCTRVLALGLLAVALGGCASSRQIGEQVLELNKGLENGHNGLLMLNVVRAYLHRPMHFMRLSSLRGAALPTNSTFNIPLPVGPDAINAYNFSASLNTARPTFDLQILDNQEFVRGITTPIPIEMLLYYLDQGWPQQMVLHLFVRTIDVLERRDGADVLVQRLNNYPQNEADFEAFQSFLGELRGCNIETDARSDRAPFGPVHPASAMRDPNLLASVKRSDLQLVGTDERGEPVSDPTPAYYRFFEVRNRSFLKLTDSPGRGGPCRASTRATVFAARAGEPKPGVPEENAATRPGERTIVFGLRSPEAMVYYLGELARAQIDGRFDKRSGRFRPAQPDDVVRIGFRELRDPAGELEQGVRLFSIRKGSVPGPVGVQVDFDGETYTLPASAREDRSMHVLSLVSQVLMLQNKGAELPSTTSVRIVP